MKVCIDNLPNLLYNEKRMLCKIIRKRVLAVFLTVAVWQSAVVLTPLASGYEEPVGLSACIVTEMSDDGILTVSILLDGGADFCGILLELSRPTGFELLAAESAVLPDSAVLSCFLSDERVRILIDCDSNMTVEGELAVLRFAPSGELQGEAEDDPVAQVVFLAGDAYLWEDGALISLPVSVKNAGREREQATSLLMTCEKGYVSVNLVQTSQPGCFAVGFDVFTVDLDSQVLERYLYVGVCGAGDSFESPCLVLPDRGSFCIIVRTLGYHRLGAVASEDQVYCIIDGVLYP